jgi:hypothetical protein
MSMKNSNDTLGNRTRDLPVCSAVLRPTAPPRPRLIKNRTNFSLTVFTLLSLLHTTKANEVPPQHYYFHVWWLFPTFLCPSGLKIKSDFRVLQATCLTAVVMCIMANKAQPSQQDQEQRDLYMFRPNRTSSGETVSNTDVTLTILRGLNY